jgi:hypothetical protein
MEKSLHGFHELSTKILKLEIFENIDEIFYPIFSRSLLM